MFKLFKLQSLAVPPLQAPPEARWPKVQVNGDLSGRGYPKAAGSSGSESCTLLNALRFAENTLRDKGMFCNLIVPWVQQCHAQKGLACQIEQTIQKLEWNLTVLKIMLSVSSTSARGGVRRVF